MAISEDLIANIDINTEKSKKSLTSLDKHLEMLNKNIKSVEKSLGSAFNSGQIKKTVSGVKSEIDNLDKSVNSLDDSYEDLDIAITTLGKSTKAQIRSSQVLYDDIFKLGIGLQGVTSAFNLAANAIDNLTDPKFIKRLRNILTIVAAIAKIKGFDTFNRAVLIARGHVDNLSNAIKSLADNGENDFQRLADSADVINNPFLIFNKLAGGSINVIKDIAEFVSVASASFVSFSIAINNVTETFEKFTDPDNIKRLSKIFKIISLILKFKGMDTLSTLLGSASEKTMMLSDNIRDMQPMLEGGLDSALDKFDKFNTVIEATGTGLRLLGQAGIIYGLSRIPAINQLATDSFVNLNNHIKNGLAPTIEVVTKKSKSFAKGVKAQLTPGIFGVIEASLIAAPALVGIGNAMQKSENKAVRFIGKMTFIAGLLAGGFGTAVLLATNAIASLSISLGDMIIEKMEMFEEKAIKAESALKLFEFTITGFNKTLGTQATGSLEMWNRVIEETEETTRFSTQAIQKSVKLLVAEGQALHLSVEQNQAILKRASDIAASTGSELEDVILRIIQGISGNSQALIALGINVSKTGLEHGKLIKTMDKSLDSMSDTEVQALRLNEIFAQTEPIVGAAAASLDTAAAANQKYQQSIESLQIALGSQNTFTVMYTETITLLVRKINDLPKIFLDSAGALLDFSGVALKVIGVIAKYGLTIITLTTVYAILNKVLLTNIAVQTAATTSFNFLSSIAGVQAVAVTSLSAVWANLAILMKATVLGSLQAVGAVIVSVTKSVATLTVTVLKNPLFWKATAIAAAIFLVIEAYNQLSKEFKKIDKLLLDTNMKVKDNKESWFSLSEVLQKFVDVAKLVVIGLAQIWELLKFSANGYLALKDAIFGSEEALAASNTAILNNVITMNRLGDIADATWVSILMGFDETAIAAVKAKDKVKDLGDEIKNLRKIDFNIADDLNIEIFGTQAQKDILAYQKATIDLNRLMDAQSTKLEKIEDLESKIADARKAQASSFLGLQKAQADIYKEFEKIRQVSAIKQLEDSGKLVDAEKERQTQIMQTFEDQVKAVKAYAKITGLPVKGIEETRLALERQKKAALEAAKVRQNSERMKPFIEELKRIEDQTRSINQEAIKSSESQFDAVKRISEQRIKEVNLLRDKLKLEGLLTDEKMKQLEAAEKAIMSSAKSQTEAIGKVDVIPQGTIDALQNAVSSGASEFAGSINSAVASFAGVAGAVMAAAEAVVGFIQKLIDFIPQIVNAIANIFTSLTDLPRMISEAFSNLFDAIVGYITDYLPNLLKFTMELLVNLVDFLVQRLPAAFEELLDKLPDFIMDFLNQLPSLITDLVQGTMARLPRIMIAVMEFIIKDAPKIAIKMAMVLAIEIPKAIIKGFILGVDEMIGRLSAFLSGKSFIPKDITDFGKNLGDGIENLAKNVAKESSNLFKVLDLEAEARALSADPSAVIKEAVRGLNDVLMDFLKLLKKTWMWIWDNILMPIADLLKEAWMWIWENIVVPIVDGIKDVWMWVNEKVVEPLIDGLKAVFTFINDTILKPFINAVSSVFNRINERVFKPLARSIQKAWKPIFDFFNVTLKDSINSAFSGVLNEFKGLGAAIWDGLKSGISGIGNIFKSIFDGSTIETAFKKLGSIVGDSVTSVVKALFNPLIDVLNMLKIPKVDVGGKVLGRNFSFTLLPDIDLIPGDIKKFASGGEVFGQGTRDTVPSFLTPGEFVLNRQATSSIGTDFLNRLNQGKASSMGGASQNVSINVDMKIEASAQKLDESYVRSKLIPSIKDEFKRSSLRGEFLIGERGIRKA